MVLADSNGISRVPPYSGSCLISIVFRLRGFHSLWLTFPSHSSIPSSIVLQSYNPSKHAYWFRLFPFRSPLLRKSIFLSLPAGNEMFQFPASSFIKAMYSLCDTTPSRVVGSPIRKSLDHCLLTAPQSISVFVPSFFGS